ncbi:MAG: ribonuclease III domain-containing protein [Synechococcales bacterium]|nr:ribonuclease III domain-containing protein [Synechococcales bacterium]
MELDSESSEPDDSESDSPPWSTSRAAIGDLAPGDFQRLSPSALAYLGDAIYELHVRQALLLPPKRIETYHRQVVSQVRAETQACHLQVLLPNLTETELEWVRRGRNAASSRSRRADPEIYQQASGLETLIGYLYLTNPERLLQLLNSLMFVPTVLSS